MLKVFIEVSLPTPTQTFETLDTNTHYRIKNAKHELVCLPVPSRIKETFHHQFEHVGDRRVQAYRKQALSGLVSEAYCCAKNEKPLAATEQIYLQYNDTEMVFYVTPKTKSLFFNCFQNVNRTKNARQRWYVLCALVYYAWLAAKLA